VSVWVYCSGHVAAVAVGQRQRLYSGVPYVNWSPNSGSKCSPLYGTVPVLYMGKKPRNAQLALLYVCAAGTGTVSYIGLHLDPELGSSSHHTQGNF
jgi:hypothetical protein